MAGIVDAVKYGLVILMFLAFIYTSYFMGGYYTVPTTKDYYYFPEVKANADPWFNPVVTPGEMDATAWINDNTNRTDKFVADIWAAEMIMGMTTRVSTVGGDWANAPDPVKSMTDTYTIYTTGDAEKAHHLAREENCSYVFLPQRQVFTGVYEWTYGDHGQFNDPRYFREAYGNSNVTIYRVL